ncbi:hypothetical protein ACS0TY_007140 [Phlomoides rotata]
MKSWHTARILMTSFPTSQCLNEILIRLADCVACYGSATPEKLAHTRGAYSFE